MRLLNARSKELIHFNQKDVPKYAILSHTWREDEVLFEDLQTGKAADKAGYQKISRCCEQALCDGLEYVWIDTCAIDKSSSAELQEAINSMYRWYEKATVCYAFLDDLGYPGLNPDPSTFGLEKCRWFSRGWTLQELLAPRNVVFYDPDWTCIGTKQGNLCQQISAITTIPVGILRGVDIQQESIARRMSWASTRETTREEDLAYCLLGIFDVNMPMLYGEGENAFIRLQEEILKSSDDDSILAWSDDKIPHYSTPHIGTVGVLAKSPADFIHSGDIVSLPRGAAETTVMTNKGLQIALPLQRLNLDAWSMYAGKLSLSLGMLSCYSISKPGYHLAVLLIELLDGRFERTLIGGLQWSFHSLLGLPTETIVISCRPRSQTFKTVSSTVHLEPPAQKIYIGALIRDQEVEDCTVSAVHGAFWNKFTRAIVVHGHFNWKVALQFEHPLLYKGQLVIVIGKNHWTGALWCSLAKQESESLGNTCENTLPPSSVLQTANNTTASDNSNLSPNENTTSESSLYIPSYKLTAKVQSDLIIGERVLRVDFKAIKNVGRIVV